MATPETIHHEMIGAVNRRDFATMRGLLHPDYTYRTSDGKEQKGPDAGVAVAQMYAAAFPDFKLEILKTYTQGSVSVAEFRVTGTHRGDLMGVAPTGKPIEVYVCNVCEVKDGKVFREREYYDAMAIMTQLGVAAAPGA